MWSWPTMLVWVSLICMASVTSGEIRTVGRLFSTSSVKNGDTRGAFIVDNVVLQAGVVTRFSARLVRTNPLHFQIWRPVDTENMVYRLVGSVRFHPQYVPYDYSIDLRPGEYIETQDGDRLGIFNELATCAVAYRFSENARSVFYYSDPTGTPQDLGNNVTFVNIGFPDEYSVSVTYDTDKSQYNLNTVVGTLPPITVVPTDVSPIPQLPEFPPDVGTRRYFGNPLRASDRSVGRDVRALYLLDNVRFPRGFVTKFYAYFTGTGPIRFQVWRSTGVAGSYRLVGEKRYQAPQAPAGLEVSLESSDYIRTEQDDRLGFTFENDGPIGYSFTLSGAQQPLTAAITGTSFPVLGANVTFQQNSYPYYFSLGAQVDTDTTLYSTAAGTRSPVTVSPSTPATPATQETTSSAITDGPTGSTVTYIFPTNVGPSFGRLIGHDLVRADRLLNQGALRTFLLPTVQVQEKGYLTAFWGYFVMTGSVDFQVWRPISLTTGLKYQLVAVKSFESTSSPRLNEISLEKYEYISVERGDCVGFYNKANFGLIGYQFNQTALYSSVAVVGRTPGDQVDFEEVHHPYKFVVAATFITDAEYNARYNTPTSSPGPTRVLPPSEAAQTAAAWEWISNPYLILGLFIWLVVMTIIFLGVCVFLVCRKKKDKDNHLRHNGRGVVDYNHWGTLKNEEQVDFFNPTIGGRSNKTEVNGNTVNENDGHVNSAMETEAKMY